MALERQSIVKKDFPVGRRGYDPEAVDAHLSALADEIDEFKRASRQRAETLASSASDQVRAIVEAAERSAAEIQREAEAEAREIREEAGRDAQSAREQASEQAREHVVKVSESAAVMLQRVDSMQSELSGLIDAIRTGRDRLNADLSLLESTLADAAGSLTPHRTGFEPDSDEEPGDRSWASSEPADAPEPAYEAEPAYEPEPAYEAEPAPAEDASTTPVIGGWGEPDAAAAPEPTHDTGFYEPDAPHGGQTPAEPHVAAEPAPAEPVAAAGTSEDAEGARLIALNMALNGTPRDETARYLSENFRLADSASMLDEVYASVEG